MSNTCPHPLSGSGTSQTARLLSALVPANLQLDPHELDALMVYALRMSRYIRFWDYDDTLGEVVNGDWSDFWNNDALFYLAGIGALDISSLEREYDRLEIKVLELLSFVPEDDCETDPRPEAMRQLVTLIYRVARQISELGAKAGIHPVLQSELTDMIRSGLLDPLRQLTQYDLGTAGAVNDYDGVFLYDRQAPAFARIWDFSYLEFTQLDPWLTMDDDYVLDGDVIVPLRALFKRFLRVLLRLRDRADFYLQEARKGEPNHQPHIALFVAFLDLFRHLQEQMNGLTQQHLDYYYGEILQLEKRGELPDRAHVVFQLAIGTLRDRLEAGTLFRAGKDEAGKDLLYALERDMTINRAEVAEIKTLYLQGNGEIPPAIVSAHEEVILDTDKKTETPDKIDAIQPFYSLGRGKNTLAPIGFAIASMQLETSQSNRQFDVVIMCDPVESKQFEAAFTLFKDRIGPAILLPATGDILTDWDKHRTDISNYFSSLFELSVSMEKGWETIEDKSLWFNQAPQDNPNTYYSDKLYQEFGINDDDNTVKTVTAEEKKAIIAIELLGQQTIGGITTITPVITIIFRIGKKYPAVTTAQAGAHKISADLPVLKLGFNQAHTFSQDEYGMLYSFARLLNVNRITVKTKADNVDKFKLLDGESFARIPNVETLDLRQRAGKGMYLYSDEIFNKSLPINVRRRTELFIDEPVRGPVRAFMARGGTGSFSLQIKEKNGNTLTPSEVTYYQDGNKIDGSETEQLVKLAGRQNIREQSNRYLWFDLPAPTGDQKPYAEIEVSYEAEQVIFQAENDPSLNSVHLVAGDTAGPQVTDYVRSDDELDQFYYLGTNNSYWELKIFHKTEPFTEVVYVQDAVAVPDPETPYHPENRTFYRKPHFPLFPTNRYYPNFRRPEPIAAIPDTNWANGNLFIGVKNLQPQQMLSLLFQVVEGTETNFKDQTPEIEWSYLSHNAWKRFPPGSITFDSTRGDENSRRSLVQSGIVELQMPADITSNDTLVKPGFHWIRASAVEGPLESVLALPKLAGIYAQAARVELHTAPVAVQHFDQPLPPKTISQLQVRRAAVRKLDQRFPGFGGQAPESALAWYTRVSERLRHKRRAITAWDYERLVLEKFPDVRAVKCINHTYYDQGDHQEYMAGHVSVAIMPYLTNREQQNPLAPQPRAGLLEQVSGYLRGCANHFVADLENSEKSEYLHVLRPNYQEVIVALSVRFQTGLTDSETWKLQLDQDLARFIAPWAFDDAIAPVFNREIRRMEVLYFVENLHYVDVVEDLLIGGFAGDVLSFETDAAAPMIQWLLSPADARSILSPFQRKAAVDNEGQPVPRTEVKTVSVSANPVFRDYDLVESDSTGRYYLTPKTPFRTHHLIHVL